MIRIIAINAMFCLAALSAAQPMTLDQAVDIAQRNAFDVLSAKADAMHAAGVVDEAHSSLYPKLDGSFTYVRFTEEATVVIDPNQPPIVVRPIDQKTFRLALTQTIDIFGVATSGWAAVKALRMASDAMVVFAIHNAGAKAKSAFFSVLKAEELLNVAAERITNVNKQIDVATKRYDAGTAPKFDIIRFQTDLKSAEQDKLQAENSLNISKASFNETLARDIEAPVELVKPSGLPATPTDMETLTKIATQNRGDLLAAQRRYDYQRYYSRAQSRANMPKLDLTGAMTYDPDAGGFGAQKQNISGTAVLSFPFFDAGKNSAKVKQAKADEAKAKVQFDQTKLAVEKDVKQALLNVESAKKILETAEQGVTLAEESLRLANVRYEAGVGTNLEVSDANIQYVRARNAVVNATYGLWDAVANLQRAVGKEDIS